MKILGWIVFLSGAFMFVQIWSHVNIWWALGLAVWVGVAQFVAFRAGEFAGECRAVDIGFRAGRETGEEIARQNASFAAAFPRAVQPCAACGHERRFHRSSIESEGNRPACSACSACDRFTDQS